VRDLGRSLSAVRAAWGLCLIARPEPVLAVLGPHSPSPQLDTAVLRVLGARQLAQASVTALVPSRKVLALGAIVDVLHAASMVGLAAMDADRRREGLLDACLAGSFALASMGAGRGAGR
jgi:hypothetical protein